MSSTPRYWVQIGSGSEQLCETLGLAPVVLSRANLQPDAVTFEQSRVRGAWAVDLAHDTEVKFYIENANTTLSQLFRGRVVSPAEVREVSRRTRQIEIRNTWQFAKEVVFHRGDWAYDQYVGGVPSGSVDDEDDQNGDVCTLYYGPVEFSYSSGSTINLFDRNQTVTQAVAEVLRNLGQLVTREAVSGGWGFTVSANWFGTDPLKPSWSQEGPLTYLDWLIKCVQPVPDAFASWDYTSAVPALRVGRYRDQTATEVAVGYPFTGYSVRRAIHEELAGMVLMSEQTPLPGESETDLPFPGHAVRWLPYPRPTGAVRSIDRRVRAITVEKTLYGSSAAATADYLAAGMLQPSMRAALSAAGEAWRWLKPGAVVEVDGQRLNVQSTEHDLATGVVSASAGLPRQLGVEDAERLQEWLRRWALRRR